MAAMECWTVFDIHHTFLQDLEERFTLFVALVFVVAEDVLSTGQLSLDLKLVRECLKIFLCEILVDILKHVTLAKFNNIRPGTYREFFRCVTP